MDEYRRKTLDPAFNGAVLDYKMEVLLWNERNMRRFTPGLTICKELFMPAQGVFYTRKNFYGLQKMNEKIERLQSSGFIQHFVDRKITFTSSKVGGGQTPSALTVHQLAGTLQILSVGCAVAIVIFVLEVLKSYRRVNVD